MQDNIIELRFGNFVQLSSEENGSLMLQDTLRKVDSFKIDMSFDKKNTSNLNTLALFLDNETCLMTSGESKLEVIILKPPFTKRKVS